MRRALVLLGCLLVPGAAAAAEPLVLVVHGIGGGNRADGWSDGIARAYGVPVTEVTFRVEGRTDATSLTDFARQAGDWALSVQQQIQAAVRRNPGRRVIIVSHSWGTVATKLALAGGTGGGSSRELVAASYGVPPIDLGGARVDEWVTLGSPLGRAEDPRVAGNLRQLNVDVPVGRPGVVDHWTNVYDEDDPVARQSHNLDGADNVAVTGGCSWWDLSCLTAHTAVWSHPRVVEEVRGRVERLAAQPSPPRPPGSGAWSRPGPGGPEAARYQRLAQALVTLNEQDCQRRMADPAYGGSQYRIEYLHVPEAQEKDGSWYIVGAWCLMEKAPDRDRFHCAFQRGDAGAPQWISVGEVDAWVTRAGIRWR